MHCIYHVIKKIHGCPGQAMIVQSGCCPFFDHPLAAQLINAVRHAACPHGIRDQADPAREQCEDHADDFRMDMQAIADQFHHHIFTGKSRPNDTGTPVMQGRHGIKEVGDMRCPGLKCLQGLLIGGIRVGERNPAG